MSSLFASLFRFLKRLFRLDSASTQRNNSQSANQRSRQQRLAKAQSVKGSEPKRSQDDTIAPNLGTQHLGTQRLGTQPALQPESNAAPASPVSVAVSSDVAPALRRLIYRATCAMPKPRMHAGQFASLLRRQDSSFTYRKYNFTKLIYLLEAVPDLVVLDRVEKPEAAPAYYVRPLIDMKAMILEAIAPYSDSDWVHIDSLKQSIFDKNPGFSLQTYGFANFKTFLESGSAPIEFKLEDTDYLRTIASLNHNGSAPSGLGSVSSLKLTSPPKRRPPRPVIRPKPQRQKIIHISPFAGFSPDVLNQKVSELAAIALPESWYFGANPPDDFAYPILKSYLRYTFIRLQHERKVVDSPNGEFKSFNTGLLDRLLRPIYALLSPYPTNAQVWDLTFCIPGEAAAGKKLVAHFNHLPTAANYLKDPSKAFYDLAAGPPKVDWPHIIKDNMERLPCAFIAEHAPANFIPLDTTALNGTQFHAYKKAFAEALDADPIAYRNLVNRLSEALSRTLIKTQINYKTAVPTYYPTLNSIDLLLPICLVEEDIADCAIVARQSDSGTYIGHTILTMRQAYNNARLICKLDEHWLSRAMTLSQESFEEEDDDSEEFESESENSAEDSSFVNVASV
ncbi:DUF3825 domain-containing protein [cf. Phormidesmis sp. LEGE 11477]|uniref:DUF3825 domain-containing protein n=1 Tax=cf. Phormidesmis sp. LEGE 11477 TaxID=1828680 RepID=UPI00187EBE02|nr:DUF3825 domain-containing protein [cf. Phormidesmis sp. LEGE 11477]MBE9061821.1 DUF3825 domain-containing protein [cf. Phormidesmis sp. LEGE 11477]